MEFKSTAVAEQDPRRTVLRALLVLLAGLLAAPLALPAGPLSGIVLAQEAEEEEEEAPAGPTIKFLNPSDYGEFRAVSDRDMEEHGYHLVATVHQPPANARVIFEAESASAGRRPIGIATREGPDTFGLHWQIPEAGEFPRGSYTFRAILFNGNEQISADEITASVQPNWPTVRLDHPSGGGLGVYQPPGDNARWNTVIDYTFSSDTEIVAFFYTMTAPGRDLEWHHCGNARVSSSPGGGASEPGSGRHLCVLEEEHDGRQITAVAAVRGPLLLSARDRQPYFYDINALSNFVADSPNVVGFDPVPKLVDYLVRRAGLPHRRQHGRGRERAGRAVGSSRSCSVRQDRCHDQGPAHGDAGAPHARVAAGLAERRSHQAPARAVGSR
jgi:hypothetical protein